MTQNSKKNIVVIGGGYTGLVAALRLAEAGHKVTVLERGDILGGLASNFTVEGASLERAYHHLFKTDTYIINLAHELGVGENLEWHDSSLAIYYDHKLYPFGSPISLLSFSPLHFHNRIRAGLVVLYLQLTKNWQRLQRVTAYEWMKKASGSQVSTVIWEPLLKGKFDIYYDKVSMAWLWARIHIRANSKEKGAATEKLGYFAGGFQVFTDALIGKLRELNVTLRTGVEIQGLLSDTNGVTVKMVNGSTENYDDCIATTPSHVFAKLIGENKNIPADYIQQLNSIKYLGARLLIFSSPQDISPYYWHNVNDVNLPFLVFINHTKLVGRKAYNNQNIYYIGAYLSHDDPLFTGDDSDLEAVWFAGLQEIFPDFDRTKVREKHFFRFANAQHIVDTQYAEHIPKIKTPLPHLYLSNFSQIYPEDRGTNYAVREGERVAELITGNDLT